MSATIDEAPSAILRFIWGALGLFFAGITARVLLNDVHSLGDLTAEHFLTIGALVGAIAAGVFFWHMLWDGKILTALGLGLAFSAATVYCLIGSAGRADDLVFAKNADARQVNDQRARFERDREETKKRWETAMAAETSECSGGVGIRCKGRQVVTAQARKDFEVSTILVNDAKPEARENGKLKRAAEIVALVKGTEVAQAEKVLAIFWPFIPPSVCELLTISFLHLAFAVPVRRRQLHWPKWSTRELPVLALSPPMTVAPVSTVVADTVTVASNQKPHPKPKRKRPTDVQLMHEAIAQLGGVAKSQDQLAEYWGISKGEVAKRVQACGDFLKVRRIGRCHEVRINDAFEYV